MDGIYTLWSRPRPNGQPRLSRLEQLLLAVSVVQWRTIHGRALLYCDTPYANYLNRRGLLDLFDAVDTSTLDSADTLDIDPATFWSFGRMLALEAATVPFVALDCDLIIWRDLTELLAAAPITVTHWESTEVGPWYPNVADLSTPPGYRWQSWMRTRLPAANISVLHFGDTALRDTFVREALRFAIGNHAHPRPDLGAAPELLFAEQRLLPLVARHAGAAVTAAIDAIWSPNSDVFITNDRRFGTWDPLGVRHQPAGVTHAWFHKAILPVSDPRRRQLVSELITTLRLARPELARRLAVVAPQD